jgi:hypothetical protein
MSIYNAECTQVKSNIGGQIVELPGCREHFRQLESTACGKCEMLAAHANNPLMLNTIEVSCDYTIIYQADKKQQYSQCRGCGIPLNKRPLADHCFTCRERYQLNDSQAVPAQQNQTSQSVIPAQRNQTQQFTQKQVGQPSPVPRHHESLSSMREAYPQSTSLQMGKRSLQLLHDSAMVNIQAKVSIEIKVRPIPARNGKAALVSRAVLDRMTFAIDCAKSYWELKRTLVQRVNSQWLGPVTKETHPLEAHEVTMLFDCGKGTSPTSLPPTAEDADVELLVQAFMDVRDETDISKTRNVKRDLKLIAVIEMTVLDQKYNPSKNTYISTIGANTTSRIAPYKSSLVRTPQVAVTNVLQVEFWTLE